MRTIFQFILLFFCIHFLPISLFSQTSSKDVIDKFTEKYTQMYQNEDFSIVKDFYSDSIRLMPEFQETVMDLEDVASYYKALFERFTIKEYNRSIHEMLDLGSRIIEIGQFNMKLSDLEGEYALEGKYVNIWIVQADKSLKLFTEAWNYNHEIDFGHKLVFKEVPSTRMALQAHVPITDNISFELAGLNALMELIISEHDGKLWSKFYADDGISLHSFAPMNIGRKELDTYYLEHAEEMPVFEKLDVRTDRIEELDGYVIEYATAIANWRMDEWSGISTSKNIRIWKRQSNGSLKIYRLIAMYDL